MTTLLYIFIAIAVTIVGIIIFKGIPLYLWWRGDKKVEKYNNAGHRFFDRVK
jgi:hypothetical protein